LKQRIHFFENGKKFYTEIFYLSLLLSCFFVLLSFLSSTFVIVFSFLFPFLYLYLFTHSCFRPLLPTHSPHSNSSSSTYPAPLHRRHGTVVLSWAEGAPIIQPECHSEIQTVIVLRFLTVLKADPTQLTNLCK